MANFFNLILARKLEREREKRFSKKLPRVNLVLPPFTLRKE